MQPGIPSEKQFVVDSLTTLREEKFSLPAWGHFLARSWAMSYRTANDASTLRRSWRNITISIGLLLVVILLVCFAIEGSDTTLRILPGFLCCVLWQQSDLYWHLGLNRQVRTGELLPTVGIANTLTWLRALGASFLLGRLFGGVSTPSWLALFVFLCGVATDILDGYIARRISTQSKLGQLGDSEADFCLSFALTIILMQNAILPLWLGALLLLRFLIPLLAVLSSYFLLAQPVRFGSTIWGKFAGLAQCLYFLVLLAPTQLTFIARLTSLPLLIIMLILLVMAPIVQFVEHTRV